VRSAFATVALLAACAAGPLAAQSVIELQGGGSSLYRGYGATANVFHPNFDGWIGFGYLRGLRFGIFARTSFGKDTLRLGNDVLIVRFPTDLFSNGFNLLVQGASYTRIKGGSTVTLFGGASADGLSAPGFQATNIREPLAALFATQKLDPRVQLFAHAQVSNTSLIMGGVQGLPTPGVRAAITGGESGGNFYSAASLGIRRRRLDLNAAWVFSPDRFRRLTVPAPLQTETDKFNLAVTLAPTDWFTIGGGQQNYVQDSSVTGTPVRASGTNVFIGLAPGFVRLTAGVYDSRSQGIHNLSTYMAVGKNFGHGLDAEFFLLQSRPSTAPSTTTPLLNLRERFSPRLLLLQQLSYESGRAKIQVGGNLITKFGEFGVDYQIVQQPFKPLNPFRSALTLTARVQLGSYSTRLATIINPDGSISYTANGSTFLYLGEFGGVQPLAVNRPLAKFIVKGRVVDEDGAAVDGAAIDFDGEMAFSNQAGEFQIRVGRPKRLKLTVKPEEFLLPGRWLVVRAPEEAQADAEERAESITIVLRRAPN
jgi:hypothetical protein